MLGTITSADGVTLPRLQFAEMLAVKHGLTVEKVLELARACETDMELPDDTPANEYACTEEFCKAVEYTKMLREAPGMTRDAAQKAKEGRLTVLPAKSLNSQELEIVEAARSARLDNSYQQLREIFDFAEDMSSVKPKANVIVSPVDWGKLYGFGRIRVPVETGPAFLWFAHFTSSTSMMSSLRTSLFSSFSSQVSPVM